MNNKEEYNPISEPFRLITARKPTSMIENTLYHVLFEGLSDKINLPPILKSYEINRYNKDLREALFIQIPIKTVGFEIFPGFKLVEFHLSIDRFIKLPDSFRKLPPNHSTLYYQKNTTRIEVHIYYNHLGLIIDQAAIDVKQCIDGLLTADKLSVTSIQLNYLLEQTEASQELLQSLLQYKTKILWEIVDEIDRVEKKLEQSNSTDENMLHQIIRMLNQYSRYNGQHDGRIEIYEQRLLNLSLKDDSIHITEQLTSERVESLKKNSTTKQNKSSKLKSKSILPRTQIQEQIIRYIQSLLANNPLNPQEYTTDAVIAWIVDHQHQLKQLEELFLELTVTETKNKAEEFIATQWAQLPCKAPILSCFKTFILNGELKGIEALYPMIDESRELFDTYLALLDFIENGTGVWIYLKKPNKLLHHITAFLYDKNKLVYLSNSSEQKPLPIKDKGLLSRLIESHARAKKTEIYIKLDDFCNIVDTSTDYKPDLQRTLLEKRILVADFLNEKSAFYSNLLLFKQFSLSTIPSESLGHLPTGILCKMHCWNNFPAFKMYLRHGIKADSIQSIVSGRPLNALESITVFYSHSNDSEMFINELFLAGARITPLKKSIPNILLQSEQWISSLSLSYPIISLSKYLIESQTKVSGIENSHTVLGLSIALHAPHFPNLVMRLALETSIETLVKETMWLFETNLFFTQYDTEVSGVYPKINFISSKKRSTEAKVSYQPIKDTQLTSSMIPNSILEPLDKGPKLGVMYTLFDETEYGIDINLVLQSSQGLLTQNLERFSQCQLIEKKIIIHNLYQLLLMSYRERKVGESIAYTRAIVFCCSLTPCQYHENEILLKSLAVFSTLNTEKATIEQFLKIARIYFNQMSLEDTEQFKLSNKALYTRIRQPDSYDPRIFSNPVTETKSDEVSTTLGKSIKN